MSPKERFRAEKATTEGFNDLVDSTRMQIALDAAMLEMQGKLQRANDSVTAAANQWRIEGAQMFRNILENLNREPQRPTPQSEGLNYRV